jgi:hypothetical protein
MSPLTLAPAPAASGPDRVNAVNVDMNKPITQVQVRLVNGKRVIVVINLTAPVSHLRQAIVE